MTVNQTRRPQVLLADDYVSLHDALTRLLSASCDIVGNARDGAEAIDAARRLRPDVVIVDVRMPGMNGLDACSEITSAAPGTHVIVITADDDPDLSARALEAGAAVLIPKFRLATDLVPAIQRFMKQPR